MNASGDSSDETTKSRTQPSGVLLVDKPVGITSHDVVDIARRAYRVRRIGHTGTLDPAASGLMLLLVGTATKIAPYLTAMDKTYRASIQFGATSDTGDAEGTLAPSGDLGRLTSDAVTTALGELTGDIVQKIPSYAAIRTNGERRYKLARQGKTVPAMESHTIVHRAALLALESPVATVRFRCSSGTYVRSLAEALGELIGCGAYLAGLRRECVGRWSVDDAIDVERLRELGREKNAPAPAPIDEFLDYPRIEVTPACAETITQGRAITSEQVVAIHGVCTNENRAVIVDADGRVLAIGIALFDSDNATGRYPDGTLFEYRRVLV